MQSGSRDVFEILENKS